MVATNLTETGWENGSMGTWTNSKDIVKDLLEGIIVAEGVTANTLRGNDRIRGTVKVDGNGTAKNGIDNDGKIDTGKGHDRLKGTVKVDGNGTANDGIDNHGKIETGKGHDQIKGIVKVKGAGDENSGINNHGKITMGRGKDTIKGNVLVLGEGDFNSGIRNTWNGFIDTGKGHDTIHGKVAVGSGDDNFGILNEGTIETSKGHDRVIATGPDPFSGFGGGGHIYLGDGNDRITGFGHQTVDGGDGFDTAKFDFFNDSITIGSSAMNSIEITFNEVTMSFIDVERFVFCDQLTIETQHETIDIIVRNTALPISVERESLSEEEVFTQIIEAISFDEAITVDEAIISMVG